MSHFRTIVTLTLAAGIASAAYAQFTPGFGGKAERPGYRYMEEEIDKITSPLLMPVHHVLPSMAKPVEIPEGVFSMNAGDGAKGVAWAVGWNRPVSFSEFAAFLDRDMQVMIAGIDEALGSTKLAARHISGPTRLDVLLQALELAPGADWEVNFESRLRDGRPDPIVVDIMAFDPSVEKRPLRNAELHTSREIVRVFNPGEGAGAAPGGPSGGLLSEEERRRRVEASPKREGGPMDQYIREAEAALASGADVRKYQVDVSGLWGSSSTAPTTSEAAESAASGTETESSVKEEKVEPEAIVYESLEDYSPYYRPPGD